MKINGPLSQKKKLLEFALSQRKRSWVDVFDSGWNYRNTSELPREKILEMMGNDSLLTLEVNHRGVDFCGNTDPFIELYLQVEEYRLCVILEFYASNMKQIFIFIETMEMKW